MFLSTLEALEHDDREYMLFVYQRHKRLMYATAKKLCRDQLTLDDLVQDSLIKLIPKVKKLQTLNQYELCSYIVFTVQNTAKNYLRDRGVADKHVKFDDGELSALLSREPLPEEALMLGERLDLFHEAWQELDKEDQDILVGKYVLELSDAELALQFDCKPDSIRMKLTRARRSAYGVITQRGIDYVER